MTTDIAKVHDIEWFAEVPRSIWKHTLVGLLLMAGALGGFSAWAFLAPLAAAVIAPGSFVATGQNKIVQHLEGGIIKEILANEGDHVKAGEPLLRLDETAARANERELFLRRARLETTVARVNAEVAGADKITFPDTVEKNRNDPDIVSIVQSQNLNFEAWRTKLGSEIGLLVQNIESFRFRSEGYRRQLEAVRQQLSLLQEEYEGKRSLLDKGLIRRTEIKSIQRAMADAEGQIGQLSAEIAETGAQITKQEQQIAQTRDTYRQTALDELQNVEGELDAVREKSREAESVLRRATIDAPVSGTVVRMYYHTPGGVIESGKSILEILPADVPLIIEAQVSRTDIDDVKVGQTASVRLTALSQRTTPVLTGKVFYVSADALRDTSITASLTGPHEVYLARISLAPSELARVPGFAPTPGMPAEVLIETAERSFFDYLTKPIRDSMARAFMEH
ncbi:HlyD family type I secretion periplasmic adaptor subunit [Mesorhizobium sp. BAC0120]|uniref:HlyD family type I secretion periplasmic adaptor subunit n=1 Tax=Mesorhizobium sp. BAC0120 TaxID=3090670 RepID=UPI00298C2991|nr:HlyD family type I secretion periplasmic adaptor subunit [Mesorhizobium sp. BAC0120]MDW6026334.1 HlyD family type I secretion periplasmic adaptor subunit [Mesorhizobium sp. BAC0120]